jgi:hypothetical protein
MQCELNIEMMLQRINCDLQSRSLIQTIHNGTDSISIELIERNTNVKERPGEQSRNQKRGHMEELELN